MAERPADPHGARFFTRFAIALWVLILLGFGGRALTESEEKPPAAWILIPHIVSIAGWYLLFAAQASLIGSKRRELHKRLGMLSPVLSLGLLITSVLVMAANYRLKGDAPLVFFNVLNLSQFTGLYLYAMRLRRSDRAAHARLMLYAGVTMMPPALVRMIQALSLPEVVTIVPIVSLWIPGIVYDRRRYGRIHRGTKIGVGTILVGVLIGAPIGFSETWAGIVETVIGR